MVWTHDSARGDKGYVYDADGVDLGKVVRCNVDTGLYEIFERVDTTTFANVEWRTYKIGLALHQAKAPLTVVPLKYVDEAKAVAILTGRFVTPLKWFWWKEKQGPPPGG